MRENPSIPELYRLLQPVALVRPGISEDARKLLGASAEIIEQIGLPTQQADWFQAESVVELCHKAIGTRYNVNGNIGEIAKPIQIGRSEFGRIITDGTTGHIVYVDQSGETQLINTSLQRFLYFIGRFRQSADRGFDDVLNLKAELERTDPVPLENPDGIWSLSIEEAEAGLY
jgi:hypothetical protein